MLGNEGVGVCVPHSQFICQTCVSQTFPYELHKLLKTQQIVLLLQLIQFIHESADQR